MLKPNILSANDFLGFEDEILERFSTKRTFRKGELVMGLSEKYGKYRYYVLSGKVSRRYLDFQGGRHTMGLCGKGSIFPLFYPKVNTALEQTLEFVAVEDSVLVSLDNDKLEAFLRESPDLSMAMMAAWGEYATYLSYRIETQFDSVTKRVCGFLLLHSGDGQVVKTTHAEIAQAMGTTRENVTRVLARLKAEGIVEVRRGSIAVLSRERLCAFSSSVANLE